MQLSSTVSEPCCGVFLRVPAGFFSMTKWILCPTINPDSAKNRGNKVSYYTVLHDQLLQYS